MHWNNHFFREIEDLLQFFGNLTKKSQFLCFLDIFAHIVIQDVIFFFLFENVKNSKLPFWQIWKELILILQKFIHISRLKNKYQNQNSWIQGSKM